MPVFLWAEMSFRVHWFEALRTEGAPAVDDFMGPVCHLKDLLPCTPEADDLGVIRIHVGEDDFLQNHAKSIPFGIICQTHFAHPEKWIHRRLDVHAHFVKTAIDGSLLGELLFNFLQELLDPRNKGLQLDFFNQQGNHGLAGLTLDIKYPLTRLTDGICCNVQNWIQLHFLIGHGFTPLAVSISNLSREC